MLTCIGYQSKGSWHDLKKRGDDWLEFCRYVETLLEDWLFRRMVRPEKGDNAIGISVVLQAKYGWSTSNKQILAGSKGEPIETRVTPQEVTRALDDL